MASNVADEEYVQTFNISGYFIRSNFEPTLLDVYNPSPASLNTTVRFRVLRSSQK